MVLLWLVIYRVLPDRKYFYFLSTCECLEVSSTAQCNSVCCTMVYAIQIHTWGNVQRRKFGGNLSASKSAKRPGLQKLTRSLLKTCSEKRSEGERPSSTPTAKESGCGAGRATGEVTHCTSLGCQPQGLPPGVKVKNDLGKGQNSQSLLPWP